jgi:hypothetical protein
LAGGEGGVRDHPGDLTAGIGGEVPAAGIGVQPRYGQKPPSAGRRVSFCCSDEVLALVVKAAVEAEHREVIPT